MLNEITEGTQNKFTLLCNSNNTNVCLNFVDFLRHNDGVGFTDLLLPHGFVVKVAVMLVAVAVDAAEQSPAAAREARESNLLLAEHTPVLLLLSVFFPLMVLGSTLLLQGELVEHLLR